jgi:1-acyl-sn-glycerol-3-phosphate acyltransferase
LHVLDPENIPQQGPCLIAMNHYFRPGFPVWWLSMGISAALPMESHWIIASEWTAPGKWYEPIKGMISRFVSNHIVALYGFSNMPPMPPRPQDVEARARSVRTVLSYMERTEKPVLCIAPEGADMPGGSLSMPPSGVGRFMLLLARADLPVTPVGGWEAEDGSLYIRFGPAFDLSVPSGLSADEKDRCAAREVMTRLASLLPVHLRGDFA